MLRRIPLVPMLLGACAALVILSILGTREEAVNTWHVYAAGAAIGAAYVLIAYIFFSLVRRPRSTTESIGCGCAYAVFGYFFLVPLAAIVAMASGGNFVIRTDAQVFASLFGFCGLGLLGGLMLARTRKAEAERQTAALERQQLELARDLQQRLLPPPLFENEEVRITACNVPAAYIAGDFYDIIPLTGGGVLIVVADVAGKGVAAGLIMATVKGMIPLLIAEDRSPSMLLRRLNERLQLGKREFVAMVVAFYADGVLRVANAGMPDPLRLSGEPIVAGGPRYPLGIRRDVEYEETSAEVDGAFFYSDGLPEATINGEPVGYERIASLVAGDVFARLEEMGATHDDDWTAVTLQARLRSQPTPDRAT